MSYNSHMIMWLPRALAIIYLAFISMLSFNIFGGGYSWNGDWVALFIHFLPVYYLIALLITAWLYPPAAGAGFILIYMFIILFFKSFPQSEILLFFITLPPFVIGIMFLMFKEK